MDRTLGSEINVWAGLGAFKRVRGYSQFKGFDRRPDCIPSQHGDFNRCPYWRSEFWTARPRENRHTLTTLGTERVNCYPAKWNEEIDWTKPETAEASVRDSIRNLDRVSQGVPVQIMQQK